MKLLTDNELKKLNSQDRQNEIIEGLNKLRLDNLSSIDIPKLSTQILKLYLLEHGESIDVDFSNKPSSEDPDNKKMIRDDVFYSDFSERIKKLFTQYNHRDLEKFMSNIDPNIELDEGVKLLTNKFKLSIEEATKIFKSYHGIGE